MVRCPFKQNLIKLYCGLLLFTPLISFAQSRYNVVKDYGFENNDTIWVEYESGTALYLTANRHSGGGYESKWCGMTDAGASLGEGFAYCYLEQKLAKRVAKDYNRENNIRYFLKTWPTAANYNCFYISIGGQKNRLIFLYHGYPRFLPQEDESTHVVDIGLPNPSTYQSWEPETLNFYKNWTAKFPETDTIEKLRLASYECTNSQGTGLYFQTAWWDDVILESTRPDSDAAVVDISFSGSPKASVQNKGAVAVSFPTICNIFKGGSRVYTDTVNVNSLAVDSIKQVSFKPYADTGEMKIYSALPGDQNPSNDTLSKNLGVQEVPVMKPLEFKVWPALTRGMINYESDKSVTAYDPTGRMMATSGKRRGIFILEKAGVYFVKSGGEVKKIVVE